MPAASFTFHVVVPGADKSPLAEGSAAPAHILALGALKLLVGGKGHPRQRQCLFHPLLVHVRVHDGRAHEREPARAECKDAVGGNPHVVARIELRVGSVELVAIEHHQRRLLAPAEPRTGDRHERDCYQGAACGATDIDQHAEFEEAAQVVTAVAFHGHEAVVRLIDESSREVIMARVPASRMPQVGQRLGVKLYGPVLVFERGTA